MTCCANAFNDLTLIFHSGLIYLSLKFTKKKLITKHFILRKRSKKNIWKQIKVSIDLFYKFLQHKKFKLLKKFSCRLLKRLWWNKSESNKCINVCENKIFLNLTEIHLFLQTLLLKNIVTYWNLLNTNLFFRNLGMRNDKYSNIFAF